jgi:hypothetical protein
MTTFCDHLSEADRATRPIHVQCEIEGYVASDGAMQHTLCYCFLDK